MSTAEFFIPSVAVRLDFAQLMKNPGNGGQLNLDGISRKTSYSQDYNTKVQPLIRDAEVRTLLREKVALAKQLDPTYIPVNFDEWFEFIFEPKNATLGVTRIVKLGDTELPVRPEFETITRELMSLPEVDSAHTIGPYTLPAVNHGDDPHQGLQKYLDDAPVGIGARYAWGFNGGDGAGSSVTDIEWGWNLKHEDLVAANIQLVGGANRAEFTHGTPVLGEMLMRDNNKGGVGIVPNAKAKVVGMTRADGSIQSLAEAIGQAVSKMQGGEVFLVEMQAGFRPMEIEDSAYQAIKLATTLGATVIEPAGNGGFNLDTFKNGAGRMIFNRNSPDFRDSGAIMVGAGSSTAPHSRLDFSNYGTRVDVYSFGEDVMSCQTDDAGNDNTLYTGSFSGTSAASPIIAGTALAIQGLQKAVKGNTLTPKVLRDVIKMGGTASASPASDKIGVQPNLKAIINSYFNLKE